MKSMDKAPRPAAEERRDDAEAQPASEDSPERLARMEEIRAEVRNGTYRVDAKRVAEALVKQHIVR
jgi:anti-sigma28 factor (negative regulator of flagellin synthesis)